MSIQEAYNQWSATYDTDENLTRDLDRVVTRKTLSRLSVASILEIGCGTGKNTALLSQIGMKVYAVDFSQSMIARAKEKLQAGNVSFAIADITKNWPFKGRSFDLITCNLVLEHIENLEFIYSEAYRTLREKGRVYICELHPFKQYLGKKANFHRDTNTIEIQAFTHHLSDFLMAGANNGLALLELREWWHEEDRDKPPRLVSFLFEK